MTKAGANDKSADEQEQSAEETFEGSAAAGQDS